MLCRCHRLLLMLLPSQNRTAGLLETDEIQSRRSFVGTPVLVGEYYVAAVLQIPESVFEKFPPLAQPISVDSRIPQGHPSFVHACVSELLSEAGTELHFPEPGRGAFSGARKAGEIVRVAASNFMRTPAYRISQRYVPGDILERFNLISSLMYEGLHGAGHLVLADPSCTTIDYLMRFKNPVPFREPRWARKILQMASADIALIADSEFIFGIGKLHPSHSFESQSAFVVDFLDHYDWQIRIDQQILLRCRYGDPMLPQEDISRDRFIDNASRLFPASVEASEKLWKLYSAAIHFKHGSMMIISSDAAEEASRLAQQGTTIEPTAMTPELLMRASGIDGTILLDPDGMCHAVGVILDGMATPECTPSRGSRFNSAVRYVGAGKQNRLAIVVSDDRTVDVFPLLRPRVDKMKGEQVVKFLENTATPNNYHTARNWLDDYRFYLTADQCTRVNEALQRIESSLSGTMTIIVKVPRFELNLEMNDSYFLD